MFVSGCLIKSTICHGNVSLKYIFIVSQHGKTQPDTELTSHPTVAQEKIEFLFTAFDEDGDGAWQPDEFYAVSHLTIFLFQ